MASLLGTTGVPQTIPELINQITSIRTVITSGVEFGRLWRQAYRISQP